MQRFIIFSAGWNCAEYVERHINSIKSQTYKNYIHVIVDDASTDNTFNTILDNANENIYVYKNINNLKWCNNAVLYLKEHIKSEEDVIVLVDLDDWLAHDKVLELLNKIYIEEDVWLTYGQYDANVPNYPGFRGEWNESVIQVRNFRQSKFTYSALRTFKAFLWQNIDIEDLKDWNGNFARCTYDQAIMFPMLEMCQPGKIRFIGKILYIYNLTTSNNDEKIHLREQRELEGWFRSKKSYNILERNSGRKD